MREEGEIKRGERDKGRAGGKEKEKNGEWK